MPLVSHLEASPVFCSFTFYLLTPNLLKEKFNQIKFNRV